MPIDLLGMIPTALGSATQMAINRNQAEWNAQLNYNWNEKALAQQQKYNQAATDYNMQKPIS